MIGLCDIEQSESHHLLRHYDSINTSNYGRLCRIDADRCWYNGCYFDG